MTYLLFLIIGFVAGWWVKSLSGKNAGNGNARMGLIEKQALGMAENKKKLTEHINSHASVTNDDVENLLGVSDSSATRYLEELEKEGLIRQVGTTGAGVRYERVS